MIEEILPAEVISVEAFGDLPDIPLFAEEEAVVARAVTKRRNEFATVRACARAALGRLGLPPVPIVPGERGAPGWPSGVVGSMTHCDGYRCCAVAWSKNVASIGVDAEPNLPLPDSVLDLISLPTERAWIGELSPTLAMSWDRLLFCAKESVYKAWFPLARRWLDFAEAEITVEPLAGTFRARLLVPGPLVNGRKISTFDGRFLARGGIIVTAIALSC